MVFDNAANVRIKVVSPIVEQQWFTVFGREYDVQQNSVVGRHGLAPVVASRLSGWAGYIYLGLASQAITYRCFATVEVWLAICPGTCVPG